MKRSYALSVGAAIVAALSASSASAGEQTYRFCDVIAQQARSQTPDQAHVNWLRMCYTYPGSRYFGSCTRESFSSVQAKRNFCFNYRYDGGPNTPGGTP